ncbi:carboxylesterase/lipase family protein [Paraglaciecola sp. MB-3u-78]|uniref:carboxylesterase/lipase family protein n=1 Tax=Paraglaciecola sp. MB-3u-78 TaxID=2058332 RepID=UPI000C31C23E|nr:carboxylesterase family protein [Paraglaciecola sp. MB-3u-78]PKG97843.1 carboxylesterase [Paraglaciecola sp. MB-3u-78]
MASKKRRLIMMCFCVMAHGQLLADTQVNLSSGSLVGTNADSNNIVAFKGISFAAPPVDTLRWKAPQPVSPWQGTKQATEFGPQCMQNLIYDDMKFRSSGMSEDCLYLNVWTPNNIKAKKRPVLLYFYGWGFVAGDGSERRYDGASMARKDIVVITANYRLGLFGLMAHPLLSAETSYRGSGNYTFLDQAAALQWVVENIAAFGGDPSRITIAGESAGSVSVSALMASPLSRDLVAGVIGESGSILGPPLMAIPLTDAEKKGQALVSAIAGDTANLSDLRKIPATQLLNLANNADFTWFSPTIDGYFLPLSPQELYANKQFSQVPLLAGVNSQEGSYQNILKQNEPTVANYKEALQRLYPHAFEEVFSLYSAKSPKQVMDAAQDLASDRFISYGTYHWMDTVTQSSSQPSFYYSYQHIRPVNVEKETPKSPPRGATHSAEIEYVLGNLDVNKLYRWQEEDYKVSKIMQQYFANFIKFGDPNSKNLPSWPLFAENKLMALSIQPKALSIDTLKKNILSIKRIYSR